MAFNTSDYAIYLPAVNESYADFLTKPINLKRPFPVDITINDLKFWQRGSKLYHYKYILHSIGQFSALSVINNSITRDGRTDRILIGDSGGFQIGNGKLKGFSGLQASMDPDDAVEIWTDAIDIKTWIVGFLETHCQYAMTIDMPLWAKRDKFKESPFHLCTVEQLTDMTVDNLRFIDLHRQGRTKWLNVIQGLDEVTTKYWWDRVKWFKHGGWSLAGGAGVSGGLAQLLRTVLMMRDDDAFTGGNDWVHVLGVSQLRWSIMLTKIQSCLRKTNSKLVISYDSASAFQQAGKFEQPVVKPLLGKDETQWTFKTLDSTAIQGNTFVGSNEPFPIESPLGNLLTLGHLNVRPDLYEKKQFDTVSNMLLINHNVWVYLDAFERANDAAFKGCIKDQIPDKFSTAVGIIEEAFDKPDWYAHITKNKDALDAVAKAKL